MDYPKEFKFQYKNDNKYEMKYEIDDEWRCFNMEGRPLGLYHKDAIRRLIKNRIWKLIDTKFENRLRRMREVS